MSYRWLYASEKVAICSDRLYVYYQNNDGIIANLRRTEDLDTDRMQVLIRRAEFFEREREKKLARLLGRERSGFCTVTRWSTTAGAMRS